PGRRTALERRWSSPAAPPLPVWGPLVRSEFGLSDGLEDEEEEAHERPAFLQARGKHLRRSVRRRRWLADGRDAKPRAGEGIRHGVQWSVPEGQDGALAIEGVVLGVSGEREVVGIGIHDRVGGGVVHRDDEATTG